MKYVIKVVFILLMNHAVAADVYEVSQMNKTFSKSTLNVKVGDRVEFPNKDPFFHNIYSLSPIKTFELGSYPPGVSRGIMFDKPGKLEVNCAIHPQMKLMITVESK